MIRSPKYAMSPKLAGGHLESHDIPRRLREKPIKQLEPIEGVSNALKIKASKSVKFDLSGFGKQIGKGQYGTVYLISVSLAFKEYVKKNFNSGGTKIFASFPNVGSKVIVKLQKQNPQMSDTEFLENVARENTVHKNLTTSASCYKIPLASRPTCITNFVPKFYLSWTFSNGANFCATIMDSAGDESIQTFAKSIRHISPEMYAKFYVSFEQAICSLWLAGYVHGDLHRENVIINRKTGAAKLIDFGFALKLPQEFVKRIADKASSMIAEGSNKSFADLWTENPINGEQTLVEYTNRIMSGKHYSWYNPDYKILQTVYNEIPRGGKAMIPSLRSRSWGIVRARKIAPTRPAIAPARPAIAPARPAIAPKKVVAPTKKKTPWKPKNGRYWADETPPSPIASSPVKDATPPAITKTFDKVNAKGRKVFKDDKGRTYVKQGDKKVYVKKLFTPKADTPVVVVAASPATNVGKVNAKKRKVFKNSKGRTYVKQGDKKVYVKKLFTPKADTPVIIASPIADTGKVNAKKRKVFVDTKKRTYVKQGDKKVYVRKLFTPKST